jgi:glutathione S-transferase
MTDHQVRLYRHRLSGHSHRVELFLSLLGVAFQGVDVDLAAGAHKAPDFLARNPFGQVPVLEDGDVVVCDSNAILVYLALTRDPARRWYPAAPRAAAEVQGWLSVAAGQLAQGPAAARLVNVFKIALDHERAKSIAGQILALMDGALATGRFIAGQEPTIADVALYSYTALAPEGDIPLEPYPAVRAWLQRIERLPGFVAMARAA